MSVTTVSSQKRSGTVLFADVVGFTSFAEKIGEEAAFELIQSITAKMQAAIHAHNGTIGEFRGDGIMALFSVTSGLEDGPLRACQAALKIQRTIADTEQEMTRIYGTAPQVRVGLHCGPLVVGDVGDQSNAHVTIIGDTANVASRLEGLADPGQVLITRDLFVLVEGQVKVRDLGAQKIRGKAQPVQVFALEEVHAQVSRFEASRSRGLSRLVDRDLELAQLEDVFQHALAGQITMASIQGEPGIGKSRLLYEFQQTLPMDRVRVLKGDCRADGTTVPFLPFADILRIALDLDAQATAAQSELAIDAMITETGLEPDTTRFYLMALLGKAADGAPLRGESADMIGARIRQLIIDLIVRACLERPLVLIVEDLHWADPGTLQIIERLLTLERDVPLMMLVTCRPNFQQTWLMHTRTTRILPKPISEAAVSDLIKAVMAGSDQAEKLAELAIKKAEGNPLYAEEIAKFLVQRQESVAAGALLSSEIVLPTNLQNMVMARFDKLGPACRKLLQAASAIGRRFDASVAHGIVAGNTPFNPDLLQDAVQAEVILLTKNGYQFKHALVQDAIYDTLLRGQRRELHALIANELEHRFSNRAEEAAEALAYHFDQAEMPMKAAPHLIAAGLRNLSLFSLEVAGTSFARAFELIEDYKLKVDPALLGDLFSGWFEVQQWRAEFRRIVTLFETHRKRLDTIKGHPTYPRILALAGIAYCQNKQFGPAEKLFDQAIAIGEKTGDRDAVTHGCLGLMGMHCTAPQRGCWETVRGLAARINALWGDDAQPYYRTYCDFYETWSHSIRGDIDQALEEGQSLYDFGKSLNYSGAVGYGAICLAFNEAYSENYDAAIDHASEGATAAGGKVDQMVSLGLKGLSMVLSGDTEGGAELLNAVYEDGIRLDYRGVANIVDGPIGLAKAMGGDLGGGVAWIRGAIERALDEGNSHGAAMSHISLGSIYLMLATGDEKPDLKTLAKNAMFLLREVPFAKSKALYHFDTAVEMGNEVGMIGVMAQALHGKGMTLKAKRKTGPARAALQDARQAVGQIRWSMMENRINADLAALG